MVGGTVVATKTIVLVKLQNWRGNTNVASALKTIQYHRRGVK